MKRVIVSLFFLALVGCATTDKSTLPEGSVARVFGEYISQEEFDSKLETYINMYNTHNETPLEGEELLKVKNDLLTSLIDRVIYLKKFDELELSLEEGSVENQINQIEASFGSTEAFEAELVKNGFTRESFTDEVNYQFKMRELGDFIMEKDWDITQEDIDNYYTEHRKEFYDKNRIKAKASHILIKTDDKSDEEALALITSIKEEIDGGKEFSEAAKEYSQCPSGENGGDLGEFGQGAMVPEFDQKVFTMELNTISDPVKTQFGYHLILTTDRVNSAYVPQEELTEYLISKIKEERFINQCNQEADVERIEWAE